MNLMLLSSPFLCHLPCLGKKESCPQKVSDVLQTSLEHLDMLVEELMVVTLYGHLQPNLSPEVIEN